MAHRELPIPPHFAPHKVDEVWKVPYEKRAEEAEEWAKQHNIQPAANDGFRICLVAVDVQNMFCIPGFELFVGGRSGIRNWKFDIERQNSIIGKTITISYL